MASYLVIDASVVAKLYLRDEHLVEETDNLFSRFGQGELELFAPRLILYEVPASIRIASQQRRISPNDGLEAVRRFAQLPLSIVEETPLLLEEAFQLSLRHECTLYDAVYLQLAEDLSTEFITADDKLSNRLSRDLGYIRSLRTFGQVES